MPLIVVRTNVNDKDVQADFLKDLTEKTVSVLDCNHRLTMVEMQAGLKSMRGGSTEPMATMEVHHTDDKIKEGTKRDIATKLAQFLVEQLKVPLERVLVLFFDTRCTTNQSTQL